MRIGILESKDFSQKAINSLNKIGDVVFLDGLLDKKSLKDIDILFVRLLNFIGEDHLKAAKNLKIICSPTTGLNHIDLKACKKRKISIISIKGDFKFLSTIRATPEHTFGLVLSLLRNYKDAFLKDSNWNREQFKGFELYKNKVGIVGLGRVGKILVKYFKAFNTKVFYFDIDESVKDINGAIRCVNIEDLLKKSNIVVLAASYSELNYQFFDKKYIKLLKNKYFINTSRGELIDEEYLINRLENKFFKGVALDVIQNEQSKNNLQRLLKLVESNNLIITPHISGATYSSMERTEEFVVLKLLKHLKANERDNNRQ
jgi:D-3-phosphoglycerate dehydrogenase / 2-oxoglutarate reductase|tara:strand:- start:52 stop:999 length:948 start_codon:yes stop_codon:yes gene_type:complete